jgi:membrane peptidoglycan carboxypeptidase
MPTAVMNSEDYGFRSHRGFIPQAYDSAMVDDLKAGKFVRGGSTITMQLAKNLWLRRDKTIGRKVQELFLTMALESCLSKDEIMETYLNVVEFGPMVYGIHDGARYWFHKPPTELTPVEAFWLAGILTNPHAGRAPTPGALDRTAKLMARLASMGRDVGDIGYPIFEDKPVE